MDENLEWFSTKDAILVVINTRTDSYYLSVHVQKIKYFSINRSDIFVRVDRVKWKCGVGKSEWKRERECVSVWENKGKKGGGERRV